MPFKLVVFDWDGTLMDSTGTISRCIRKASTEAGLPDPGPSIASYVIGLGLSDALKHAAPGASPEQIQRLVERYRHYYRIWGDELVLFDDAMSTIHQLAKHPINLAVATGKSRLGLNQAFDQTGLGKIFQSSRCADECNSKPHPQMLFELMEEFSARPEETVMIGDTTHDIKMAHAAGVSAVGLTTGAHPVSTLQAFEPHHIFPSLQAMTPWLLTNLISESGH
jgi:phosphoglycolate phosphatase